MTAKMSRTVSRTAAIFAAMAILVWSLCGPHAATRTWLWAATSDASDGSANVLLRQAQDRLLALTSLQVELRQASSIGGQRFLATGTYAAQGERLRLELETTLASGATGRHLEVCDKDLLWTLTDVMGEVRLSRRDVQQILHAAAMSGDSPQAVLAADLGLGGLPALLAACQRSWNLAVLPSRTPGEIVLQGKWKPEVIQAWQVNRHGDLPPHVPDMLRLTLDERTLFPTLFLYLKRDSQKSSPDRGPNYRTMVRLQLLNPRSGETLAPGLFDFVPPENVPIENTTRQHLELIKQARDAALADAKSAASDQESP